MIIDQDKKVVPMGQPGEIAIRSPFAFKGYLQQESKGMQISKDGWIFTGDGGFLSHNGYIKVLGRQGDVISRGIKIIYPSVVDAMIGKFPGVTKVGYVHQCIQNSNCIICSICTLTIVCATEIWINISCMNL